MKIFNHLLTQIRLPNCFFFFFKEKKFFVRDTLKLQPRKYLLQNAERNNYRKQQ